MKESQKVQRLLKRLKFTACQKKFMKVMRCSVSEQQKITTIRIKKSNLDYEKK